MESEAPESTMTEDSVGGGRGEKIFVAVRLRPLGPAEREAAVWEAAPDGGGVLRYTGPAQPRQGAKSSWSFDRVWTPSTDSSVVYDDAAAGLVRAAALEGFNGTGRLALPPNVPSPPFPLRTAPDAGSDAPIALKIVATSRHCARAGRLRPTPLEGGGVACTRGRARRPLAVFAYGQSGSGKTHTMRALLQRAGEDLFAHIASASDREFSPLRVSAVEIYNEARRPQPPAAAAPQPGLPPFRAPAAPPASHPLSRPTSRNFFRPNHPLPHPTGGARPAVRGHAPAAAA